MTIIFSDWLLTEHWRAEMVCGMLSRAASFRSIFLSLMLPPFLLRGYDCPHPDYLVLTRSSKILPIFAELHSPYWLSGACVCA